MICAKLKIKVYVYFVTSMFNICLPLMMYCELAHHYLQFKYVDNINDMFRVGVLTKVTLYVSKIQARKSIDIAHNLDIDVMSKIIYRKQVISLSVIF